MEENTEEIVEKNENKESTDNNSVEIPQEENKGEENNTSKLTLELEETVDRLKRVMADYENYKKRNEKERETLYKTLLADIIASFLPIIDNLEKAATAETSDQGYRQGIELVLKQFLEVLKLYKVEEIETVGKSFDPELHEAVGTVSDDTLGEKIIKEEFRKGYKIGAKVIRHAMVVVAN